MDNIFPAVIAVKKAAIVATHTAKIILDGLLEHRRFQIILESIVDMAHKLRMTTVMEGVESRQELEYLKEIGIDVFQGYYFSKPIPIEEFERRYLYI